MPAKNGEKQFLAKWADAFKHTLWAKNLVEIALSCTISEKNAFYTEIQDGCRDGGRTVFGKWSDCQKFSQNCSLFCTISKINAFLHFNQKLKMAAKDGRTTTF